MATTRICPNCQQPFDLAAAIRMSGWSRTAPVSCGIRCPTCKRVLSAHDVRGLAARSLPWILVAFCLAALFGIATGHLPRAALLLIGPAFIAAISVHGRWTLRRMVLLEIPPPGVVLREVFPSAREYAYLEGKEDPGLGFQPDDEAMTDPSPDWTCSNCAQANPSALARCWKCNHGRPEHA